MGRGTTSAQTKRLRERSARRRTALLPRDRSDRGHDDQAPTQCCGLKPLPDQVASELALCGGELQPQGPSGTVGRTAPATPESPAHRPVAPGRGLGTRSWLRTRPTSSPTSRCPAVRRARRPTSAALVVMALEMPTHPLVTLAGAGLTSSLEGTLATGRHWATAPD